jgi:hypothetical protein
MQLPTTEFKYNEKQVRDFHGYDLDVGVGDHISDCVVKVSYDGKSNVAEISHGRYSHRDCVMRILHLVEGEVVNEFHLVDRQFRYHTDIDLVQAVNMGREVFAEDRLDDIAQSFQDTVGMTEEAAKAIADHRDTIHRLGLLVSTMPGVMVTSSYHVPELETQYPGCSGDLWTVSIETGEERDRRNDKRRISLFPDHHHNVSYE